MYYFSAFLVKMQAKIMVFFFYISIVVLGDFYCNVIHNS